MFSWIFWDPDRVLFTLPLIDRPIVWYGVFFALGFFVGFPILRRQFLEWIAFCPKIIRSDIEDFGVFFYGLRSNLQKRDPIALDLYQRLPKEICQKIELKSALTIQEESVIVTALNETMHNAKIFFHYLLEPLEKKRWINALLRFAIKNFSKESAALLKRRIYLGENLLGLVSFRKRGTLFSEKLALYVMVGSIVGARLGHLIFYERAESYLKDPLMIIKTWEGGLASHGGVIGIFVALLFFLRKMKKNIPGLNFLRLVDFLVIPTAFAGALIRIGNFCNQEILGKVSTLPWAIIFGHAADGSLPVPRHPVQIYEACFYMTVFLILSKLWRAKLLFINPGNLTGIFFLLVFTFRFMIEYLKEEQSMLFSEGYALVMGQVLSIPMIIFGALLVFLKRREWKNLAR